MSSSTYAVYFPELTNPAQTGYLFIEGLGSGVEGTVDLVVSVSDGERYARKKTVPMTPASPEYHNSEVHFHRRHPLIPALISHTECKILKDSHPKADKIKSTVMISKYCNGGTLADFSDEFAVGLRPSAQLSESVLWHLFASQLETLMFCHAQSLGYMDSHMDNIFLHLPNGSKFPDFYTGDLGHLQVIDPEIWEATEPGQPRQLKSLESLEPACRYKEPISCLFEDLSFIANNLDYLSRFRPTDPADCFRLFGDDVAPKEWSREFGECFWLLSEIISNLHVPMSDAERKAIWEKYGCSLGPEIPADLTWYNKLGELKERVQRNAKQARASDPEDIDFSWAKNQNTQPVLWTDRRKLLYDCKQGQIAGPFQIAKVDPVTFALLEIEETSYGICNPETLESRSLRAAGPFMLDVLVPDPLRDVPDYWSETVYTINDLQQSLCEKLHVRTQNPTAGRTLTDG